MGPQGGPLGPSGLWDHWPFGPIGPWGTGGKLFVKPSLPLGPKRETIFETVYPSFFLIAFRDPPTPLGSTRRDETICFGRGTGSLLYFKLEQKPN